MTTESGSPGSGEPARTTARDVRGEVRYRVLSPWTIAVWAVLIVLVGVVVAVWLLLAYTGGDADANRVQLDAIRTAGTVVVGTGGAAALLLAARRQRGTEIALKQKDRDQADAARAHALQERIALASEADAAARRITDLYTKAADQLGSEKAPVRLAGLYALERLAQENSGQRQIIVNVVCAYLRMPSAPPDDPPGDDTEPHPLTEYRERVQEREVRLAAQRILAHHLRPGPDLGNPVETFWADIDLDLTSATLINLDLTDCQTRTAVFTHAHFTGAARFSDAKFTRVAMFGGARFTDGAWFDSAEFTGSAAFEKAEFTEGVTFDSAEFAGGTSFSDVRFASDISFYRAKFTNIAAFDKARFTDGARFDRATFTSLTRFDRAEFTGHAGFDRATFARDTSFDKATFTSIATFSETEFAGDISFDRAQFTGGASFEAVVFAKGVPTEVAQVWSAPIPEADGELDETEAVGE